MYEEAKFIGRDYFKKVLKTKHWQGTQRRSAPKSRATESSEGRPHDCFANSKWNDARARRTSTHDAHSGQKDVRTDAAVSTKVAISSQDPCWRETGTPALLWVRS